MLKTTSIADNSAANRLLKLWAVRYLPDLTSFSQQGDQFPAADLIDTASPAGRTKTIETVKRVLSISCEVAGIEATSLYSYIPNIVQLSETRRIAQSANQVYEQVLNIYSQHQPPNHFLKFIDSSPDLFARLAMPFFVLPAITRLAESLEPTLLSLQQEYLQSDDPRAIGFLTSQFHFTTREITKQLNPYEQVLLMPYFRFVEEQVCIPWQRVCAAASGHLTNSPMFALVEALLPRCHEIAERTYYRAVQDYPNHRSRQGELNHPVVARSTLRDLIMVQGYLWLSLLEENLSPIEQELLPLCVMVFPSVGVKWELVQHMLHLLIEETIAQVSTAQKQLLLPYARSLKELFGNGKVNF
ncbi:hypothetical protein C7B76_06925 [filamentous cyanobacterium CCP2]|nr:hypothetical protein C7B76_06925 [filamentous cyanobacterium CCP2]